MSTVGVMNYFYSFFYILVHLGGVCIKLQLLPLRLCGHATSEIRDRLQTIAYLKTFEF